MRSITASAPSTSPCGPASSVRCAFRAGPSPSPDTSVCTPRAATIFEIAVGISAGEANGFTRPWWTIATLLSGAIATFFLSLALLHFDVGVGYALRTSLAGAGIALLGALLLGQRLSRRKLPGIALVLVAVVGLNLAGAA